MLNLLYALAVVVIAGLDQASKYLIVSYVPIASRITVIPDFFYITHTRNTGASFSMLEGEQTLFVVITVVAILGMGYYLLHTKTVLERVSLLFIIGGAVGNFIDRISYGYVTDFLSFRFFGWDFAIFNVADSFICVGAALLFLAIWLESKHENI